MMARVRGIQGTLLAVLLLAGACGGGKEGSVEPAAAANDIGAAASGDAATPGGAGSDGSTPSTTAAKNSKKGQQAASESTSTVPPPPTAGTIPEDDRPVLPVETTLGSTCVRAGGNQTVTFKLVPGSGVAYNSYYSDGKNGLDEGFYGGNKGGIVQADGQWTDTWTIAPHAPPGKVRVTYTATNIAYKAHHGETSFELVSPTGVCP